MTFDIQHVAALANLEIPDEKANAFTEDLAAMVKMAENLPMLEKAESGPISDETMMLRADSVQPSLPSDIVLHNAPATEAGCFLVPKTVE